MRRRCRFNPDEDIRRLERDANLGDVNAEAKLIISKVRAGIIPAEYVALAAYLEDPAALATGIEPWNLQFALKGLPAGGLRNLLRRVGNRELEWPKVRKVMRFAGLPGKILVTSAADFAEHVLHMFENVYPDDNRPRLAIQVARLASNLNRKSIFSAVNAEAVYAASRAAEVAATAVVNEIYLGATINYADDAAYAAASAADAAYENITADFDSTHVIAADAVDASVHSTDAAVNPDDETEWQTRRLCDYLLDRRQISVEQKRNPDESLRRAERTFI